MVSRVVIVAAAAISVISVGIGAQTLNPRELYNEMYPVETLKRDAFHICRDANPTFIRAVRVDREACLDSMPNSIEIALGRVRATALTMAALLDPAHQAALLQLAAMPPQQQPITAPRSFANTGWMRALSPPCVQAAGRALPAAGGRTGVLDTAMLGNLPPLGRAPQNDFDTRAGTPPIVITAAGDSSAALAPSHDVASPDLGDKGPPAIVPVKSAASCGA